MAKRRSKKLEEADKFRAIVEALRLRFDVEWRPYEDRFLETQTRRPEDYVFSDAQWKVLKQLVAASTLFTHYAGYSVPELVRAVHRYRAELNEDGEEFVDKHCRAGTTALPVRDIRYLARLYRRAEHLDEDEVVESVFRETWDEDAVLREVDEYTTLRASTY